MYNFCYGMWAAKFFDEAGKMRIKSLKRFILILSVNLNNLSVLVVNAQNDSSNLVKVYSGKVFDVVVDTVAKGRSYSRQRSGGIDSTSLRVLKDFEARLLSENELPKKWKDALFSDRIEILLSQQGAAGFMARVAGSGEIIIDPKLLASTAAQMTLEHELFHLLKRRLNLPSQPVWFEEGLAEFFAFYRNNAAVGYPLEAFFKEPAIDLREPSRDHSKRTHAWYGKSFLLPYYLLNRFSKNHIEREKLFWKMAEHASLTVDQSPQELLEILALYIPELKGHSRDVLKDFYMAAALSRSHGIFQPRFFLFSTTLSVQYESLRVAARDDSCLTHFFRTDSDAETTSAMLHSWESHGAEIFSLPLTSEQLPQKISASKVTESTLISPLFLVWCSE
jgi:hypothetical protein